MSDRCLDLIRISRYVHRAAPPEDMLGIERHARSCARCHDRLHRMMRHAETLFEEHGGAPAEAGCPSRIQLEHFARAGLLERQLARIQQHVAECADCLRQLVEHGWRGARSPRLPLHRTRPADLDVRFTPHGLRVHEGEAVLGPDPAPTLAQRLGMPELERAAPGIVAARGVHFTRHTPVGVLAGRVTISSPEAMRLALCASRPDLVGIELHVWDRERIWARLTLAPDSAEPGVLLAPGHYFVGPSELETPWLAISVEEDVPSPAHLAELAYAHCVRGNIPAALRCLDAIATAPIPGVRGMYAACRRFARAHASSIAAFDAAPVQHAPPPDPRHLHLDAYSPDRAAEIADLVRAVQRCAEHARAATPSDASRRRLVTAYGRFMRRMRQSLESVVFRSSIPAPKR